MGPTNTALVQLYRAEQELREAQGRLDSASRSVRFLERRITEINEKLRLLQTQLREQQARVGQLELDIRSREARIDKFRAQQQQAKNHKEYQAFLTEINAEKIDKAKAEEELLKVMEVVEKAQNDMRSLSAQLDGEQKKLAETQQQLGSRLAELQAEVDRLRGVRNSFASQVPAAAMEVFERVAERYEGEAMAAIAKPNRRSEEYLCTSCNMSLVADIYNRLHSRDELTFCPNCRRLLFIPDNLTPAEAINKPKERREPRRKAAAAVGRQQSAIDVSRSISAATENDGETEHPGEVPTPPQP